MICYANLHFIRLLIRQATSACHLPSQGKAFIGDRKNSFNHKVFDIFSVLFSLKKRHVEPSLVMGRHIFDVEPLAVDE